VAWQDCPEGYKDIGAFCVPGLSMNAGPWYLSFYLLLTALAMLIISIGYFRLRSLTAVAMAKAGVGGRRGTKPR
jgi:hypothetical protein